MIKTKNIIALLTVLAVLLSFCGCSALNSDISQQTETSAEPTTSAAQNPPKKLENSAHAYNSISDKNVKELYMRIDEGSKPLISIPFDTSGELTDKEIGEALEAYKNDHPEVFWLSSECTYYVDDGDTNIELVFRISGEELAQARKKFDTAVEKIISQAPKNADDYEKELFVNNYLIENCTYDEMGAKSDKELNNENNAYGAVIEKKAVCEGYARAFQLLCTRLGVDCVTVTGTVDDVNHAWNCAKIEGEWYQVDATWNDTDGEDLIYENNYFNLTDDQMYEDHTLSPMFSQCSDEKYETFSEWCNTFVPECTSKEYNYYRQSCVIITDIYDSTEPSKAIAQAAKDGEDYISFVIDDSLDFDSTYNAIMYDGYIADWIDSANWENWYSPNLNDECYVYKLENRRVVTLELEYI